MTKQMIVGEEWPEISSGQATVASFSVSLATESSVGDLDAINSDQATDREKFQFER